MLVACNWLIKCSQSFKSKNTCGHCNIQQVIQCATCWTTETLLLCVSWSTWLEWYWVGTSKWPKFIYIYIYFYIMSVIWQSHISCWYFSCCNIWHCQLRKAWSRAAGCSKIEMEANIIWNFWLQYGDVNLLFIGVLNSCHMLLCYSFCTEI